MDQKETSLLEKGIAHFKKREYQKAQRVFTEVVELNESSSDAYFYMANIHHLGGEIGKAIKYFSKVLALDPAHTDAAISLSILYNDIGKYEEAKRIFDKADERVKNNKLNAGIEDDHINKKFSSKHYEIAELYMTYNRYDEALFEYNKAVGLNPGNLETRIKIAKVFAKKGFMNKAFDELNRLKNEYPGYLPGRVALGVLYYGNGNVLEAQDEWKRVLSGDPSHQEASMYLHLSKTATETSL